LQVELRTSLEGYRRDEKGLHRYVHGATVANEEDAKQIATEAGLEGFLLSWMNQGDGNMHAYRWSEELWDASSPGATATRPATTSTPTCSKTSMSRRPTRSCLASPRDAAGCISIQHHKM
jgi:hypothetical protein